MPLLSRFLLAAGLMIAANGAYGDAIAPAERVDLLADEAFKEHAAVLNAETSATTVREEVFSIVDGMLHVSGRGTGYLRTKEEYRDYHLVLEYKWGEHTWADREDGARDGGVLVHGHGPDASHAGTWMASFQAQLMEGGSGDIAILGGAAAPSSLAVEGEVIEALPSGRRSIRWKQGRPRVELNAGYIEWVGRDPAWKNVKGFRGRNDIENPVGEWNRLEVICQGDAIRIVLNGQVVNEGTNASPSAGKICLQSEGAEYWVRRFELWPAGGFKEKWEIAGEPADAGEGLMPRRFPMSAEESMASYALDGEYRLELVAAEPLVCDPVDIVFDENGRVYVAEMRDYPLPPAHGPFLSRIRLLRDKDADGRMDEAVNWASGIDHVQGLLPMRGGLLVTTRTAVLFMKDTDGDDVADEKRILFQSNDPRHSQLQVSSPRWGLDYAVYLNNGLDAKEIYPGGAPEKKQDVAKRNLRYDPRTGAITTVSGHGQFGATLDDWGRRFSCSNRNPVMFAVMPLHAVERNPFAGLTQGHEDIALFGGDAVVYPAAITHTTSKVHHGTHTAACGLGIYRGDLMPELLGNVFVPEPPGQLVTRSVIEPRGASLWAERKRLAPRTEFLRSSDEWARPVNIRNGPDGALYVCDMYRRFIDHSQFFSAEFSEKTYMRAGFDQGRIYRIVPKGRTPPRVRPLPGTSEELVKTLAHANGWHRETAQRLLLEVKNERIVPQLEAMMNDDGIDPRARVHAFWTIEGLGALKRAHVQAALGDPSAGVVENALALAERYLDGEPAILMQLLALTRHENRRVRMLAMIALGAVDDPAVTGAMAAVALADPGDLWLRNAILSGAEKRAGAILKLVLENPAFAASGAPTDGHAALVGKLAEVIAARGDLGELKTVFAAIGGAGEAQRWWQLAAVKGLADGFRRHQGKLGVKSLASLLAKPPDGLKEVTGATRALLEEASERMVSRESGLTERLAAIPLLEHLPTEKRLGTFAPLVMRDQPREIQSAAFAAMRGFNRDQLADFFFAKWGELGPESRKGALALMASSPATALRLMQKMKEGEINPALMDPMSRWQYGRSTNPEIKQLALELFGQPSEDRRQVLDDYRGALAMKGDVKRGHDLFVATCATCHKVDGEGIEIGPDISDVRNKAPDALLSDILDPNRVVESRFNAYAIVTTDGRSLTGVIASETADALVVKGLGVEETLTRAGIASMTSLDQSLMPVGLESAISVAQMADLLAFLRER